MAIGTPSMISPPQTPPALVYGLSPKATSAVITTEDEVCRLAGLTCKRPCAAWLCYDTKSPLKQIRPSVRTFARGVARTIHIYFKDLCKSGTYF
jgi:hypothetical protein